MSQPVASRTEGHQSPPSRPLTTNWSSATLCHQGDEHLPAIPSTVAEVPVTRTIIESPPPIPPPDVVSVFDPASAGGGGPLKRITTEQRARVEAEARERAERQAARESGTAPPSILQRFRSNSLSRQKPVAFAEVTKRDLSPHQERVAVSPSLSTKTLALDSPEDEKDIAGDGKAFRDLAPDQEENESGGEEAHVYPDGGYGWIVLGACVILSGCTMGWGMTWGIFQEFYAKNVFIGENTSLLTLVGCLLAFFMGLTSFISGRMGDRYGFKKILLISAFVAWLGLFLASWSTKLWQLLLTQGVLSGIGIGMSMPLFMSLPSQWFYKKRGFASGIAMGGAGFGGGISALIVRQLLTLVGYQKTLLIMSFINLVATLFAIALIRVRPSSPEGQGGGRGPWVDIRVLKQSGFWSLAASLLTGVIGYGVPFNFLSQYVALNFPNIEPTLAGLPQTLLGFSICIGRALVGFVADRIGPINTYIGVFVISGVLQFALFSTAQSYAALCVFAVSYGLVAPGWMGLIPQIAVALFGPSNLASNVGIFLLLTGPGNLLSGPLCGAIFDAGGKSTFKPAIYFAGGLQILGGFMACWARYKAGRKLIDKV